MRAIVLTLLSFQQSIETSNVSIPTVQEHLVRSELGSESKLQGGNVCIVPGSEQRKVMFSVDGATLLLCSELHSYPGNSRAIEEHSIERSLSTSVKRHNSLSVGSRARGKGDRGILSIFGALVGVWKPLEGNVHRSENASISDVGWECGAWGSGSACHMEEHEHQHESGNQSVQNGHGMMNSC
jgi:hypothetical protein